ncbi:MAG: aldehyde dehydrogenase family protein [Bacteroidia bacterium]
MNRHEEVFQRQQAYFWEKLKGSTASEQVAKLRKMKKWVMKHQPDIQEALRLGLGKPTHEGRPHGSAACDGRDQGRHRACTRLAAPQASPRPWHSSVRGQVTYEPKKACPSFSLELPYMLTIGPLVSAVAAGCTAMVKPSEFAPATSALIEKMVKDIFPEEVAVFHGDHPGGDCTPTALPFDHVFFTGNPEVGKKVIHAAAENLTSVTLELGGRNPVIVDETAKLSDVARKLVWGKLVNAGQSCMSPNYVLVHEKD